MKYDLVRLAAYTGKAFAAHYKTDQPLDPRDIGGLAEGYRQLGCDADVGPAHNPMQQTDLEHRIIDLMVANIASQLPPNVRFARLDTPMECGARYTDDNISLRITAGPWHPPIFNDDGDTIGYSDPRILVRIDVLIAT